MSKKKESIAHESLQTQLLLLDSPLCKTGSSFTTTTTGCPHTNTHQRVSPKRLPRLYLNLLQNKMDEFGQRENSKTIVALIVSFVANFASAATGQHWLFKFKFMDETNVSFSSLLPLCNLTHLPFHLYRWSSH